MVDLTTKVTKQVHMVLLVGPDTRVSHLGTLKRFIIFINDG